MLASRYPILRRSQIRGQVQLMGFTKNTICQAVEVGNTGISAVSIESPVSTQSM